MAIVTAGEMKAIREGKGLEPIVPQSLPKKPKSEREELFDKLKKAGIKYKGNMSNIVLKELLEGDK